MSFTADDTWEILRFLGLNEESKPQIEARLLEIEAASPQLVSQVQTTLGNLTALDELLQNAVTTGLSAIKKADDVEFFEREQLLGKITRMIQLTRVLAKHMKASPDLSALQELYALVSGNTANNEPITIAKSMN